MPFLTPGDLFAERYRVGRFLAEGGMGAVFAGYHEATEMPVAIKVLRPSVVTMPGSDRQFELEAKVAARVRSDHIVKVLDAGTDPTSGLPYLVMELLEGKSLEQIVAEQGPLPAEQVVRYLQQVADGLDKAHGYIDADGQPRPIVHRDLKPDNLFVVGPDSSRAVVKILDFGIAKVLSDSAGVSQDLRGTPLYMAYEQACGQLVTPQTDVWALGLIAFNLLTAKAYWKSSTLPGGTLASLISEITTLPTTPASERVRELGIEVPLPLAFDAWLARCIDRNPQRRFASAGQAVADLAHALSLLPYARTIDSRPAPAPLIEAPDTLKSPQTDAPLGGSTTAQLSVASTQSGTSRRDKVAWPWRLIAVVLSAGLGGVYLLVGGSAEQVGPAASGVSSPLASELAVSTAPEVLPVATPAGSAPGVAVPGDPTTGVGAAGSPNLEVSTSAAATSSPKVRPRAPAESKLPEPPSPPPPPTEPPKPDDPYGRR